MNEALADAVQLRPCIEYFGFCDACGKERLLHVRDVDVYLSIADRVSTAAREHLCAGCYGWGLWGG